MECTSPHGEGAKESNNRAMGYSVPPLRAVCARLSKHAELSGGISTWPTTAPPALVVEVSYLRTNTVHASMFLSDCSKQAVESVDN